MTTGSPPSITAIQELVVPRSIPRILGIRRKISRSHRTDTASLPRYQSFDVEKTGLRIQEAATGRRLSCLIVSFLRGVAAFEFFACHMLFLPQFPTSCI